MNFDEKKNRYLILGGKIITNEKIIENGYIMVEGKKIIGVGNQDELPEESNSLPKWDVDVDSYIFPGFIDVHIHGASGSEVMDGTEEALRNMSRVLPQEGTTSFLATTVTDSEENISKAVKAVGDMLAADYERAEILGVHLEGPFIDVTRAGAQPREFIQTPSIEKFKHWQELAKGSIRLITLAPEVESGLELTKFLHEQGVIVSIGHSDATAEQVKQARECGVSHATHLYNGMRPMHHREAGVAGAVLLDNTIMAEIIFDGIHVSKDMVQLAFELKGSKKIEFITDSIKAKCLKAGRYAYENHTVIVTDTDVRLEDGTLAGSLLKMNEAVKRGSQLTGVDLFDLVRMSSRNAAEELGIDNRKGSIAVGMDADLVIMDKDFNVQTTFCRGTIAYTSETALPSRRN
jgi:N-acetylglucosamine-6-phosphate deacetylase